MTRKSKACPYCGAPVLSEVCQYCGGRIEGANTTELSAEYETIDCRNASLSFWTTLFPLVFAVMFGFFGFIFPVFLDQSPQDKFSVWFCIPFAMVSVGAWAVIIYTLYKYFLVSTKGKEITGTVYGYMDDTVQYNHRPGQICKILIDTRKGKKFIFYSILGTNKPYPVNSKLRLKAYRNYFMVLENTNEDLF